MIMEKQTCKGRIRGTGKPEEGEFSLPAGRKEVWES